MAPSATLTRLKIFHDRCYSSPSRLETRIKALDFSSLEKLGVDNTNFSQEQLDLLVERIAGIGSASVPLRSWTDLLVNVLCEDSKKWHHGRL